MENFPAPFRKFLLVPFFSRCRWKFVLVLAVAAAIGGWVPAAAFAAVGELILLKGRASIIRGRTTIPVVDRIVLEDGDRVLTGPGSKVHIRLEGELNGSELIATGNTYFRLSDLAVSPQRSLLGLIAGAIRSRLLRWTRTTPFMRTNNAVVGVKGTDFIVYAKVPNASEFVGIRGLIEARSRSLPEFAIELGKRQWGKIEDGIPPKLPIRVPDEIWIPAQKDFNFPGEVGFGGPNSQ